MKNANLDGSQTVCFVLFLVVLSSSLPNTASPGSSPPSTSIERINAPYITLFPPNTYPNMAPVPAYDMSLDELSMALSYVSAGLVSGGAAPAPAAAAAKKAEKPKKVRSIL
jgi:hypothetical protein